MAFRWLRDAEVGIDRIDVGLSPQQLTISFALEQLRRVPWPQMPIDFGAGQSRTPKSIDTTDWAARLSSLVLKSDRWTCRATASEVQDALGSESREVLVHAIDADPAVPLLAHWARLHLPLLLALRKAFGSRVTLVLPEDWPDPKRELKGACVEWVDPKYPSGHWRMLPHVLGIQRSRPLVLDSVAAASLAMHLAAEPSTLLPVAICDIDRSDPIRFAVADRGAGVGSLLNFDAHTRWIAGPRWRRRMIESTAVLGEGELVFHAERDAPAQQSPCIRCGWCEHICPTRCSPAEFIRAQHPYNRARAKRAGIDSCIQCGLCTNVCPSNLPLYQFIERLKQGEEQTP